MSATTLKPSVPLISKPFAEQDSIQQDLVSQQLFIKCLLCVRRYSSIPGVRAAVVKNIDTVSQTRSLETPAFLRKDLFSRPPLFSGNLAFIRALGNPSDISMYVLIPTGDKIPVLSLKSTLTLTILGFKSWILEQYCLGSYCLLFSRYDLGQAT